MIEHVEIANRAGVTPDDLEQLLLGKATANVARQLRVTLADVDAFVEGSTSDQMKQRLGFNSLAAADELAKAAGRNGAIGILLGLLLCSN